MKAIRPSEGRVFLSIAGRAIAVLALSLCLAQLFFVYVDHVTSSGGHRFIRRRIHLAIEYLDRLQNAKSTVAFMGASDVQVGIHPPKIDAEFKRLGQSVNSLNLGFSNLDPYLLHLWARRLTEVLARKNQTLALAAVKFSPLRTTSTYAAATGDSKIFRHFEEMEAAIYSDAMLFQDLLAERNLEKLGSIFTTQKLFFGISPLTVSSDLRDVLTGWVKPPPSKRPEMGTALELGRVLWQTPQFLPEPAWDEEERGGFFFGYKQNKAFLDEASAQYKSSGVKYWSRYFMVYSSGADKLIFDRGLLGEFIAALRELRKSARRVVVFYYPEEVSYPLIPEARKNLNEAFERIRREAGVQILDFTSLPWESEDFFDSIHLSIRGQTVLANALARDLSPLLKEDGLNP